MFDVHTHIWEDERQLGETFGECYRASYVEGAKLRISLDDYRTNVLSNTDGSIILPIRSQKLGIDIKNEYVADACRQLGPKTIGFACVDPAEPEAPSLLDYAVKRLGLRGLKLAPAYQIFDPLSKEVTNILATADRLEIPVLWHQGSTFVQAAPLRHCKPLLLDEIAKRFPRLKMIIAHMGFPWVEDTIALLRMHENLFADVSALSKRPWKLWTTLVLAKESQVQGKLLFGSDFPFDCPNDAAARIRAISRYDIFPGGEGLEENVEALIERDALGLIYG
jgi:predicted TIM-barrel fold metal-dependent hydrolase